MHPIDLTEQQLAAALRANANGLYFDEAAVELLVAHGTWLRRKDFRTFVTYTPPEECVGDAPHGMAHVDWEKVVRAQWAATNSAIQMLHVAASLMTSQDPWPLSELLASLDDTNTTLVLQAIAHAKGWHESGRTAVITGWLSGDDE